MRLLAFAIFDRAARAYFPPVFQGTRGLAERWFAELLVDGTTVLAKHPGDFELFEVGAYDSVSGKLESVEPNLMVTGVQVLSLREVANG